MWTLAINNHRMYYRDKDFAGNLGIDGSHASVINGLFRIVREITSPIGRGALPGVQFGAESEEMLGDRSMVDEIKRASARAGGPAIIHHPDDSRPSTPGFIPRLQLNLQTSGFLNSDYVVVHPPPATAPMASRLVLADLTNEVTVKGVRRSGVGIALENLGPGRDSPFLGDLEELGAVVLEARDAYRSDDSEDLRDRVGICLDFGHLTAYYGREGRDPLEALDFLRENRELVVAMHVHLNDGTGDQHLLPGERREGLDTDLISGFEEILLDLVIPGLTGCRTYIIERNSPYTMELLHKAARMIADSVSAV